VTVDSRRRSALGKPIEEGAAYRHAVHHLPVAAVFCVDDQLYMNQAAEALTGYGQGELPTLAAWFAALFGERQQAVVALYEDHKRGPLREPLMLRIRRKDGVPRAIELSGASYDGVDVITLHDMTEKRSLQRQVLDIASEEQRRVGQELHDVVLQDLTGLGLLADAARNNLVPDGPAQELLSRLVSGLRRLNVKVRALCEGLVPLEIEVGDLKTALQALADTASRAHGLTISIEAEQLSDIDRQTAHQLYRIAQEALVNVVRYSHAGRVVVRLSEQQPDGLKLEISHDGSSSDEANQRDSGLGRRIMQYRCALLGGQLQILPRPEGGSIVSCTFARSMMANEYHT
jgi:PAS domain S-box-containing protein